MPNVNPKNLLWARETASLTVEEAAKRIGFKGRSAIDKLQQIERGDIRPTRSTLEKMAKAYSRPLLALYVTTPPAEGQGAHDLRKLFEHNSSSEATLNAIIRNLHVRQSVLRNGLEDEDEAEPIRWVGSVPSKAGSVQIASLILEATGFDLTEFRSQRTVAAAFANAREAVEKLGVYVLLVGDLGHHSRKVSPKVFRGISLSDPLAPFIIINDNDSKSAWTFTLFHELTHILIGESAISGYATDSAEERLCDDTASKILLTSFDVQSVNVSNALEQQVADIESAARRWKLSRKMVAYNLMRSGRISSEYYAALAGKFDEDRVEYGSPRESGGADYYVVRAHRLGRHLIRTVNRMVSTGLLTAPKAALVLGIRPTAVSQLTEVVT